MNGLASCGTVKQLHRPGCTLPIEYGLPELLSGQMNRVRLVRRIRGDVNARVSGKGRFALEEDRAHWNRKLSSCTSGLVHFEK